MKFKTYFSTMYERRQANRTDHLYLRMIDAKKS